MSAPPGLATSTRRLVALCRKETYQIVRDPSTLLIALLFPVVLLSVFALGINLDSSVVPLGVVMEDDSPEARRLLDTFTSSPSFRVVLGHDARAMGDRMRAGDVRGFVVVRSDFGRRFVEGGGSTTSTLEVVADGSEPNTAAFVSAYTQGAYGIWLREELARKGMSPPPGISLETRAWFNPSTKSRNFLLPGSITIIMTVVGALLTALVVAREWERGTMEALLAAGVSRVELVLSKLLPYFVLGLVAYAICIALTTLVFGVELRGSLPVVFLVGAAFLGSALGTGLLLSTVLRTQYDAAQAALQAAFLPALMLSGFIFEIASMPLPIRVVTTIVPARYFVRAMQTVFQAGDVWSVLTPAFVGMGLAAFGFLALTYARTRRRLE